jgi:hypothetical protein
MAIQLFKEEFNKHLNNTNKYDFNQKENYEWYLDMLNSINNNKLIINVFKKNTKIYLSNSEKNKLQHFGSYIDIYDENINKPLSMGFVLQLIFRESLNNNSYESKSIFYNGEIIDTLCYECLQCYLLNNKNFNVCAYIEKYNPNMGIIDKKYNAIINNKLNQYYEFNIIEYDHDSKLQSEIINDLESKFNKKFNDLFENTSDIIKELKKDLIVKDIALRACQERCVVHNEKIRNLELEVYYLKSQSEKKVTIDYESIKQKNKLLNNEFKRMYKLMKFNNE